MSGKRISIAWFGSSLVSAYWNGAATYYRGIIRELHKRGHRITFYEPDAYDRQGHRDIPDPEWAKVVVYSGTNQAEVFQALEHAKAADLVIKASGVGVFDRILEREVAKVRREGNMVVFWDVDAPETLERLSREPEDEFRSLIPHYDMVLTYGGGEPVRRAYEAYGARRCVPIYNALDPTTHYRVPRQPQFDADLSFVGNRLPDRESRVEEFFFAPAQALPKHRFLLAGNGWQQRALPVNVRDIGHLYTADHNAFNSTPTAVLNINRTSMASYGYSPPTRIFEAAGARACIISDRWEGFELFLEPGTEGLMVGNGDELVQTIRDLTRERARDIGENAYRAITANHTYAHRVAQLESVLGL